MPWQWGPIQLPRISQAPLQLAAPPPDYGPLIRSIRDAQDKAAEEATWDDAVVRKAKLLALGRRAPGKDPDAQDEDERKKALDVLTVIYTEFCDIVGRDEPNPAQRTMDVCEIKATNTLIKRAGTLKNYVAWCKDRGSGAFPLKQEVYEQRLRELAAGKAPTAAQSLCEAVAFMGHLFEMEGASTWATPAAKGIAMRGLKRKRVRVQAPPAPVPIVTRLEEEVVRTANGTEDAVLAPFEAVVGGFMLFLIPRGRGGRTRPERRRNRGSTSTPTATVSLRRRRCLGSTRPATRRRRPACACPWWGWPTASAAWLGPGRGCG